MVPNQQSISRLAWELTGVYQMYPSYAVCLIGRVDGAGRVLVSWAFRVRCTRLLAAPSPMEFVFAETCRKMTIKEIRAALGRYMRERYITRL